VRTLAERDLASVLGVSQPIAYRAVRDLLPAIAALLTPASPVPGATLPPKQDLAGLAVHKKLRVRIEHVLAHMKDWQILRWCRRRGNGSTTQPVRSPTSTTSATDEAPPHVRHLNASRLMNQRLTAYLGHLPKVTPLQAHIDTIPLVGSELLDDNFDPARPNVARVYDYLLGGKNNFAADRAVAERIIAGLPEVQAGVQAQRAVLGRVVRYLVGEAGIRQLLDIGSGLPTSDNVHEIARRAAPGTRVVYVDNDPVVLAHARAILSDETLTFAEQGDLLEPSSIVASPAIRAHLDFDKPVGLLLCGILHYQLDADDPGRLVAELVRALPSGSYVFIHHLLDTGDPAAAVLQEQMLKGLGRVKFRTLRQVRALFGDLELVPPGVVPLPEWRPEPGTPVRLDYGVLSLACAGVARKR
jgi:hypothetical protein